MKVLISLVITTFFYLTISAQSSHKLLRQGDFAYKNQQYSMAEESYRKALEKKKSLKGTFNLGNTVYNQERFDEAVQHFDEVASGSQDNFQRANARYNQGNALLKNGQSDEAISSYKDALKYNTDDADILKNLYIAKMMQRQQRQQQQQQEQDQQQQNQEENQNEGQEQDQNQQSNQDPNQDADVNSEGQQNQESPQNQDLSKEDALKLLQVIENEEKSVQEKLRKSSGKRSKPKKDW